MNWAQPTISGAMIWVREEGIGGRDFASCSPRGASRADVRGGKDARKAFVQRDLPGTENYHHVLSRGTRQSACAQLSHCTIWLRIRRRNWQFRCIEILTHLEGRKRTMRTRDYLLSTTFAVTFLLLPAALPANAQSALTGVVTSAEEGAMEGVVVSAKKDGSTITVSVVTDKQGHFSFPASRLEPGNYALKARAVGYDLDGANTANVAAGKAADAQLKLKKTRNLAAQLNNAEWLLSMPGTDEQKKFLLNCNGCHSYERIVKSSYDADGFLKIFERMSGYYPGSMPTKPQRLAGSATRGDGMMSRGGGNARAVAEWLSTVNLSQSEERSY